ncbi:MAG TPA: DUF983 domain-containing protein [Bacteroidia bacterium]|jgi:uncharacterized protein (DUF983 family)|nr:DUF983 domain-containing protein [Bacteroidia bacterium]
MKAIRKYKGSILVNILCEKCPNCGEGHVFETGSKFFEIPRMQEHCGVCNYRYDREPGYFLGAMYISYAIAVFFGIATFLVCNYAFPGMPIGWIPVCITAVIVLIAKKNYRLSRIIYIHLFPW